MHIDNSQLAAFAAVLSEGTFEQAARRLNVTSSAISQRIRLLEDRMGQVLIQRTKPCQATHAGQALLRHAQSIAALESELFKRLGIETDTEQKPVQIPIAVNADSLDTWFFEVFKLLGEYRAVSLDLRAEDQDHSMVMLREGAVMAAISTATEPIQGCEMESLGAMRYLAVASRGFCSRYFRSGANADAFAHAPMLMFNRKDALQSMFIAGLTGERIEPPVYFVPSTHAFFEAVRSGLAWGMLPEQMVAKSLAARRLREIVPGKWLDVPLYWHRWRVESSGLNLISQLVRQVARRALRQPGQVRHPLIKASSSAP